MWSIRVSRDFDTGGSSRNLNIDLIGYILWYGVLDLGKLFTAPVVPLIDDNIPVHYYVEHWNKSQADISKISR